MILRMIYSDQKLIMEMTTLLKVVIFQIIKKTFQTQSNMTNKIV